MDHKVIIRQFERAVSVREHQSILDAALEAGFDYPHACRSGTCSACKAKLLTGTVTHKTHDPYAITEAEKQEGMILACRASPTSDCEIDIFDFDINAHPVKEVECIITSTQHVTHDVLLLKAAPTDGQIFNFNAGQFAKLSVTDLPQREYSFANAPGARELEFHIKSYADGIVSRYFYNEIAAGNRLRMSGPFGDAYFRKDHTGPIILVAGGTGLAPAKSILEDALSSPLERRVDLFFSVRLEKDLYLNEALIELASRSDQFQFHPIITDEESSLYPKNLFTAMDEHIKDFRPIKAYICGPPGLVRACQEFVYSRGTNRMDCHADPFTSSPPDGLLNSA